MPSPQPFIPVSTSTTGSVVVAAVSTSSVPGTVTYPAGASAATVLVTNTAAVTLFVRMSNEVTPLATTLDIPMLPNSQRVFAAPNSFSGSYGVASIGTGLGNGNVIFTPGNGGL